MDRKRFVVFGVAAVGALTLAVAAGSVAGPLGQAGGGGVSVDIEGGLVGDVVGTLQVGGLVSALSVLGPLWVLPGLLVLTGMVVWTLRRLGAPRVAGIAGLAVVWVIVGAGSLLLLPEDPVGGGGGGNNTSMGLPIGDTVSNAATELTVWLTPLVGLVLLAGLGAGTLYLTRGDDPEDPDTEPIAASGPREVESLGAAAGRAAEEIQAEPLDNAVYRAWQEMVRPLPVEDPETTTPREFADYAVDAGVDPEAVADLTSLFEQVRYSDTPVTDERRERAEATLRRIEEASHERE